MLLLLLDAVVSEVNLQMKLIRQGGHEATFPSTPNLEGICFVLRNDSEHFHSAQLAMHQEPRYRSLRNSYLATSPTKLASYYRKQMCLLLALRVQASLQQEKNRNVTKVKGKNHMKSKEPTIALQSQLTQLMPLLTGIFHDIQMLRKN